MWLVSSCAVRRMGQIQGISVINRVLFKWWGRKTAMWWQWQMFSATPHYVIYAREKSLRRAFDSRSTCIDWTEIERVIAISIASISADPFKSNYVDGACFHCIEGRLFQKLKTGSMVGAGESEFLHLTSSEVNLWSIILAYKNIENHVCHCYCFFQ